MKLNYHLVHREGGLPPFMVPGPRRDPPIYLMSDLRPMELHYQPYFIDEKTWQPPKQVGAMIDNRKTTE